MFRGIYVPYVGRVPVENLGKVVQAGFHFDTQSLPEFDILVVRGGEVIRGFLGSLGMGMGVLHGV